MGLYSFRKEERLCKRKQIKELFEKGSSFYSFPFKVFITVQPEQINFHQVLFSVPNRIFKRAVDRNKIKRRLREAYRLQKEKLQTKPLAVSFVYTAKNALSFEEIQAKLILTFGKIEKTVRDLGQTQS